MNPVIEAIKSRRSVKKMLPDPPVSRELVETVIEAAVWAPNHHLTEPWRFVVMAGDERRKLGEAMSMALGSFTDSPTEERLDAERKKPLAASVIVALISSPKVGPNIVPQEEMVAAGAALQNMLLAAHSLGLGSMVRTGSNAYSEAMRKFFQMKEHERVVGLVYLGHVAEPSPPPRRSEIAGKVEWRGI
jgi:nitroreductase